MHALRPRPEDERVHIPVVPLIDEETFALAQEQLVDNKHYSASGTKTPSLLQGLVVCRKWGYACYRTSTTTARRREAIAQELARVRKGRNRLVKGYRARLLDLADLRERYLASGSVGRHCRRNSTHSRLRPLTPSAT